MRHGRLGRPRPCPGTFAAPRRPLPGPGRGTPGRAPSSYGRLKSHPGSGRRGPTSRQRKQSPVRAQGLSKVAPRVFGESAWTTAGPRGWLRLRAAAQRDEQPAGEDTAGGAQTEAQPRRAHCGLLHARRLGPAPYAPQCPSRIPARPQRLQEIDGVRRAGRGWGARVAVLGLAGGPSPPCQCPPAGSAKSMGLWTHVAATTSI